MARKLPWIASATTNTTSGTRAAPAFSRSNKRVKIETDAGRVREQASPSIKSERASRSSPNPSVSKSRPRPRDGRSVSTSPPPAPPPTELMRPGFDEDDIYMLVEDEFQTIAQGYTAHLHHAEYKRLMKLAKDRKAEQQRSGTDLLNGQKILDIVSGETRQQLKRKLLSERQSSGVKSMLDTTRLNDTDDDEEEDDAQEAVLAREEKKVSDMWAGTALGGLMSWDHSQERPSLKGLEKLGGETRASRGYGPSSRQTGERKSHTIDVENTVQKIKRRDGPEASTSKAPRNSSHLDRSRREPAAERNSNIGSEETSRPDTKRTKLEKPPTKPPRSRFRSLIDSFDDFDDAAFDAAQAARHSESPEKSRVRSSVHHIKKEKKDKRDRLDEVPVFII